MSIQKLPSSERPRERCLSQGATSLSLRECIAVILGTGPPRSGCLGVARMIMDQLAAGMSELEQEHAFFASLEAGAAPTSLRSIAGLGNAGQARLLAALELGRRYALFRERQKRLPEARARRSGLPEAALARIADHWRTQAREWLGFVPLFRSGRLGELCIVELGVRTHVNLDPAELFARILSLRPQGYFLFHNHPSGDPTPSAADIELTRRARQISEQLGIQLFGHGVVAGHEDRWVGSPTLSAEGSRRHPQT